MVNAPFPALTATRWTAVVPPADPIRVATMAAVPRNQPGDTVTLRLPLAIVARPLARVEDDSAVRPHGDPERPIRHGRVDAVPVARVAQTSFSPSLCPSLCP